MKLLKINELNFDTEDKIRSYALSKPNELVLLISSGDVIRYDIQEQKKHHLFSVKSGIGYADGGFDMEAKTTIYNLDEIVVLVNDYKRHGFVHYPNYYEKLHLWRGNYHADISTYPIALFKDELNIPHLIYAKDWNHLQIMNLNTRQVLTAAKSLIEEGAEERHIEFYKNYPEGNKLPWPHPYDYFFGRLEMSPNQKHFLSAGWAWGSVDACTAYEVEDFIQNSRISVKYITQGEHLNRAVCWVDNESIVIIYSPFEDDGEESVSKETPQEIHFYKLDKEEAEKKIQIMDLDIVNSEMYFNQVLNTLILCSNKFGAVVISLEGEILFQENSLKQIRYNPDLQLFTQKNENVISIYKII